jgi:hypothetical protein
MPATILFEYFVLPPERLSSTELQLYYATSWKVGGSSSDDVIEFFQFT